MGNKETNAPIKRLLSEILTSTNLMQQRGYWKTLIESPFVPEEVFASILDADLALFLKQKYDVFVLLVHDVSAFRTLADNRNAGQTRWRVRSKLRGR